MTTRSQLAIAEPLASEARTNWVLTLSLDEPGRVPYGGGVIWAERGPLRGFFDGLLFDREILAKSADCSSADSSDADLILRAYERGGAAALARLRGSFVLAIIDGARGIAIVARDPFGVHPLFYHETRSRVLFATSPQLLLRQPGISRSLNHVALADHLCDRWPDRHETFFAALRRLPAGWRALVSPGRLRLERYWDPMPPGQQVHWLTDDAPARFEEVFDRAVDRCLDHGPTGIFLSGGLDSISVAAVAADRARATGQRPPLALSLGFPDPECDERLPQAAVARDLGLRQHLVGFDEALGSRALFESALALNKDLAAPVLNPWQPPFLELARRARHAGIRTILTGHGGDEWLCVTPYLAADLMRRGAFLELARFVGALRRSYKLPALALARHTLWKCGLRPLGALALHRLAPRIHKTSRLKRLLAGDPFWIAPNPDLRAQQRHRAEAAMAPADPPQGFYMRELWTDHPLMSWESEERHELGKRIGVRFLHPFSDPDVVEMLCRTPPSVLSRGGRMKGLVRHTLARRFPGLGFEGQRKVSAKSFFEALLLREGPTLADVADDFPALSALGVLDGPATRAVVRQELMQPGPRFQRIWNAINLECWVRSHVH
jgi:asparagine synthetase B (glutamine-hydrolysing)